MISDNIEQKSELIKLREEMYSKEETIKSITNSIKRNELEITEHIKDIEKYHIKGLTNAINQIKQRQEHYHTSTLASGKDHYGTSRIGNVLALQKDKSPFRF
jgi:hypothetical protein